MAVPVAGSITVLRLGRAVTEPRGLFCRDAARPAAHHPRERRVVQRASGDGPRSDGPGVATHARGEAGEPEPGVPAGGRTGGGARLAPAITPPAPAPPAAPAPPNKPGWRRRRRAR